MQLKNYDDEPFDGILPIENYLLYHKLSTSWCYSKKQDLIEFYWGTASISIICYNCRNISFFENELVTTHKNWHKSGPWAPRLLFCDTCNKDVIDQKPAIDCGYCTDQIIKEFE